MQDIDEKNVNPNSPPHAYDKYEPPRVIRMGCFRAADSCVAGDWPGGFDDCISGNVARQCTNGQNG